MAKHKPTGVIRPQRERTQAMKALVVVESMWGNTRLVAEAVARGLDEKAEVFDVQQALPSCPKILVSWSSEGRHTRFP